MNCIFNQGMEWNPPPLTLAWNSAMEILVSAFEICSGLLNKHQLWMVAKRRPCFLWKLYLHCEILIQKFWPYYGRSIDCLGQLLYEEYLQLHCFSDEQSYRIYHLHLPIKCMAKILGQNLDIISTSCKRMQ